MAAPVAWTCTAGSRCNVPVRPASLSPGAEVQLGCAAGVLRGGMCPSATVPTWPSSSGQRRLPCRAKTKGKSRNSGG